MFQLEQKNQKAILMKMHILKQSIENIITNTSIFKLILQFKIL